MLLFFLSMLATSFLYPLSLHDALPISSADVLHSTGSETVMTDPAPFEVFDPGIYLHGTKAVLEPGELLLPGRPSNFEADGRSEEHTSELQSRGHLVCRLLLEKKKKKNITPTEGTTR